MASVVDSIDRIYRLTVEQYDEMARTGLLTKNDRVELIEGFLVEKLTKNSRHVTTTSLIQQALATTLPRGWSAVMEWPIVLEHSEPEPDVSVVLGSISDYFRRKPAPADLRLVVEVSDSSYADDVRRKIMYASSGIAEYWIANIPAGRIEVYTDPRGGEYRTRRDASRGETLIFEVDGVGLEVQVDAMLAPVD